MNPWHLPRRTAAGKDAAVVLALLAAMLFWLWPIGPGGMMPVGGDVTQFFLGLMGVFSRSLQQGRLPSWNALWGYGFPGLGESQMGVYYPPHVLLYGLLATERAYVASLVLHTLWGALGAWSAARRFGVSSQGSGLAALAFSASGFFVIHMPHPWGYTTGCWLPWAWGLAWSILASQRAGLTPAHFCLCLVLVLQLLPGHFQIAFMTQCGIVLTAFWHLWDSRTGPAGASMTLPVTGPASSMRTRWRAVAGMLACVAAAFPLGALQLWPTARLARLASSQRGFEYLSGFALTPFHLVSLVAPGLFHRSPLWRPLAWDAFHTSPEELLVYVGLAPLFLALLAVGHEYRRDRSVRLLVVLGVLSLVLGLGPYAPGFRWLIALPGFSFFRAPARWSLVTSLVLAILAGKGLDGVRAWSRAGRELGILALLALVWVLLTLGLVELAFGASPLARHAWIADAFQRLFESLPWTGDPGFFAVLRDVRGLKAARHAVYLRELSESAGVLAALAALAALSSLRRLRPFLPAGLVLITLGDLGLLGRHRLVHLAPLAPLVEQSPLLARLAGEPRGTRVLDGFGNLSMLVGLEPVVAYRTLDLPALLPLSVAARGPLNPKARSVTQRAMRAAGVGVRVLQPAEAALERRLARQGGEPEGLERIDDPTLARWLSSPGGPPASTAANTTFGLMRPSFSPSRAWFLPLTAANPGAILDVWRGEIEPLLRLFEQSRPLPAESPWDERLEVTVAADSAGWVILSQLADPQWRARLAAGPEGPERAAEILPTFRHARGDGGWQRVRIPGPGLWTLRLDYLAGDVRQGLAVSALAWLIGAAVLGGYVVRRRRRRVAT